MRKTAKPCFETLEDRMVPASIKWLGTTSDNWMTDSNWQGGTKPGTGDYAILQNVTTAPKVHNGSSPTVLGIKHDTGSGIGLTIDGTLTLSGGTSEWDFNYNITGGGWLNVKGTSEFKWKDGYIDVALMDVCDNSTLYVMNDALGFRGSALQIGYLWNGSTYIPSNGYLFMSDVDSGDSMTNSLALNTNTVILNSANGHIYFDDKHGYGTGGFSHNSATNRIRNNGEIYFREQYQDNSYSYMGIPIVNEADTAILKFGNTSTYVKVEFDLHGSSAYYGVHQLDGTTYFYTGDDIDGEVFMDWGEMRILGSMSGVVTIGYLRTEGGYFHLGQDFGKNFVLVVTGDVDAIAGDFVLDIDGENPGNGDYILIGGDLTETGAGIEVYCDGIPDMNDQWTLFSVDGSVSGNFTPTYLGDEDTFASLAWDGGNLVLTR